MKEIEHIRNAIKSNRSLSCIIEVGKYQWEKIIRECHDPFFIKHYSEWSGRQWIDLKSPGFDIASTYNSGKPGAINYSHIGNWQQPCFWFVYDEYDKKVKVWVLKGALGKIIDCINEIGWVNSTISDTKGQKWLVTYEDTVWYCERPRPTPGSRGTGKHGRRAR